LTPDAAARNPGLAIPFFAALPVRGEVGETVRPASAGLWLKPHTGQPPDCEKR
jgi:hypothetical protein